MESQIYTMPTRPSPANKGIKLGTSRRNWKVIGQPLYPFDPTNDPWVRIKSDIGHWRKNHIGKYCNVCYSWSVQGEPLLIFK